MTWNLKWGAHVKALEQRARRGHKVAALESRPKLTFTDLPFQEAFTVLNQSRSWGFSAPNPITLADVIAYCSLAGIASRAERLKYLRLIQLLDQAYIAHHAEKTPSSSTPPSGSKNKNKS